MKKIVTVLLLGISISALAVPRNSEENTFLGEQLNYKIKFGWFKVGNAEINVDSVLTYFNEEPHYFISFKLKTSGILKAFANLDVYFESYVHAESYRPFKSKRLIKNGKKVNNQHDTFTYADSIYVETYRESRDKSKTNSYELEGKILLDALSTYLFVRDQDLDMTKDEELRFYIADDVFDFRLTPNKKLGKGKVKSYQMVFPPIDEFPRKKTSYAFFNNSNVPVEMKIATNSGNFYLILED